MRIQPMNSNDKTQNGHSYAEQENKMRGTLEHLNK